MYGVKHDHLTFFNNSASNLGLGGGLVLGGVSLVPGLNVGISAQQQGGPPKLIDERSALQKHAEIVEYLKRLPPGAKATAIDINKELRIDFSTDLAVLNMVKNNSKVEVTYTVEGEPVFLYRPKFVIANRQDLVDAIERNASGIVLSEIRDHYENLESDVQEMIVGGDIIALKNKEIKSLVLYPRGAAFLTELSGAISVRPGDMSVSCTLPLYSEIRRGEAIRIGDYWYRVSLATKGVGGSSSAPTSVVLEKDVTGKLDFAHNFDHKYLPLDGDFEGDAPFSGAALRHGCTTDIQSLWNRTAEEVAKRSEQDLSDVLVSSGLLSSHFLQRPAHGKRLNDPKAKGPRKRAKKMGESQMNSGGFGVNEHLRGTTLARVLKETREQNFKADNKVAAGSSGSGQHR